MDEHDSRKDSVQSCGYVRSINRMGIRFRNRCAGVPGAGITIDSTKGGGHSMKNVAKFMSAVSFGVAFVFYVTLKGGIGEISAPKDFFKK
jgi:hypothetical protein